VRERPRGGAWSAAAPLPGAPIVTEPVMDAAGNGALAIAWRGDRPRIGSGIAVALRDPAGELSERIVIVGPSAGGVRHPAIAIDGRGDALLAYNTGTLASHLHRLGKIAVTYRPAGGAFSKPVVVDRELAALPAVALAPDGTGVVTWMRRNRVYAVAVGAGGRIGRTTMLSSAHASTYPTAAAAAGGAATVVWSTDGRGTLPRGITAAYRPAGSGTFGRAQHVANDGVGARAAADDDGRMAVAWITTSINAAFGVVGQPLVAPRRVAPRRRTGFLGTPSVAAAGGRALVAWGYRASNRRVGVQAATASQGVLGPPQMVGRLTVPGGERTPTIDATIDPQGPATVLFLDPWRKRDLFAADGT